MTTQPPPGAPDASATLADGLDQLESRYDQHAAELVGAGEDLLLAALDAGGEVDPVALRQALAPRLRPLLDAAAALEDLAVSPTPPGRLAPPKPDDPGPDTATGTTGTWPRPPDVRAVSDALGLRGRAVGVHDATVARLTITRVFQTAGEHEHWTAGDAPAIPAYDGDVRTITGNDQGWADARWEGIRAGTVEPLACSGCDGSGRVRCAACGGSGVEPCPEFEPCRVCHGSGKRPRVGRELLRGPCAACNGRGAVPCPLCGGQGRRPCQACGGGTVACGRCQGLGRITRYRLGVVERRVELRMRMDADALRQLGRGADRYFRPLARLTADRAVPGLPETVAEQVTAALAPVSPDQVRQRVQIDVLPAAAVTHVDRGEERTVYLLGEDEDLGRRKVVRPGRGRWPGRRSRR